MALMEIHWSIQGGLPLLGMLQLLPLIAAAIVYRGRNESWSWILAVALAGLELLLAITLWINYDPDLSAMQFSEHLQLLGPFGYHAGADGLTVLFVLLNAFLTFLIVIYGQVRGLPKLGTVLALVLATEAASMSMLVSLDLLWFALVSALHLLPTTYIMQRWATSPDKDQALNRFGQFMATGLVLLLTAAIMLGWNHADSTGSWSFDLFDLTQVAVDPAIGSVVFFLLFYGLAVRTPLFPLHGWLPAAAEHGNIAVAPVLLLGLKLGIYGMLRFLFPLLPDAVVQWHPYIVAIASAGIFYAALLALMQNNIRRLLAYAVVSHTSILVIGLFSLGQLSFQGSILLSVNFGLGITGLVMMTGLVYRRTHTMQLSRLGGLFDRVPLIGITFFIAALSIVGMPGTPGFDSVHLVLEDAMHRFGALVTVAAALGNVVAAGFLLWAFQRAFLTAPEGKPMDVEPTSGKERLIAMTLLAVLLGTGFYSEPWLRLVEGASTSLSSQFANMRQLQQE